MTMSTFPTIFQKPQPSDAPNPDKVIYMAGCVDQGDAWFKQYLIPIAGVVVGIAVLMVRLVSILMNFVLVLIVFLKFSVGN